MLEHSLSGGDLLHFVNVSSFKVSSYYSQPNHTSQESSSVSLTSMIAEWPQTCG